MRYGIPLCDNSIDQKESKEGIGDGSLKKLQDRCDKKFRVEFLPYPAEMKPLLHSEMEQGQLGSSLLRRCYK